VVASAVATLDFNTSGCEWSFAIPANEEVDMTEKQSVRCSNQRSRVTIKAYVTSYGYWVAMAFLTLGYGNGLFPLA
jgi:hypothetical protein